MKTAIEVRGGVVQRVSSDEENAEVAIYDYDNEPELASPEDTEYPIVLV